MADMRVMKKALINLIDRVGIQALEARGFLKRKEGTSDKSRKLKDYEIGGALPRTRKQVIEIIRTNQRSGEYAKGKIDAKAINREAKKIVKYAPFVETDVRSKSGYKFSSEQVKRLRKFEINKDIETTIESTRRYKKEVKAKTASMYKKLRRLAIEAGIDGEDVNNLDKNFKRWKRSMKKNLVDFTGAAEMIKAQLDVREGSEPGSPDV